MFLCLRRSAWAVALNRFLRLRPFDCERITRWWCYLHKYNLAIRDAIQDTPAVDELLAKGARLVRVFRKSAAGQYLRRLKGRPLQQRMVCIM